MGPALSLAYGAAAQLARALATVTPDVDGKLARTLRARRAIRERYTAWGRTGRDTSRPLLWMHAPSVGEGLQARPVLTEARARRATLQIAYSFYSPSAESFARTLGADFTDYLPFDTAGNARVALDALRPTVLAFSKLDVWPLLAREASNRRVPLALISATLAEGSGRRSRLAGSLLRDAYGSLNAVGAVHADDAARLVELGVRPTVITVTGDTRYDQVWDRAESVRRRSDLVDRLRNARPTVVVGSSWPADERHLLPALQRVNEADPGIRIVIAPHEPTAGHVDPILQWAREAGFNVATLDAADAPTADVILVNRVGVLGELYALADAAFVGGGFHAAGLHSVLEPAAFGAPVLFGPQYRNSRDAVALLQSGGGSTAADTRDLAAVLVRWISNPASRREAGARARALVSNGRGATARTLTLLEALLDRR